MTEFVCAHQGHQGLHPLGVQFVENVVQQQQGLPAQCSGQPGKLGQFNRNEVAFLLALGADFFKGTTIKRENKVVLVQADAGVLQHPVFCTCLLQQGFHGGLVEVGFVLPVYFFLTARQQGVEPLEFGGKGSSKCLPGGVQPRGQSRHLEIIDRELVLRKNTICGKILQQGVPLLNRALVLHPIFQVRAVGLSDHPVQELPAQRTALGKQVPVGRRYNHHRKPADVVRQPGIFRVVDFEGLFLTGLDGAMHLQWPFSLFKTAPQRKVGLSVPNMVGIAGVEVAFGGAEVVDGVQYIGFSRPILAHKGIETG